MNISEILKNWEAAAQAERDSRNVSTRIAIETAAKISALAELFPGQTQDHIINDLLTSAINEVERKLPYVKGSQVVTEDELGDPIYADAGLTPQFHALTQKFLRDV